MKVTGYSIWLVPEAHAGQVFGSQIERLATRYGGPFFGPHITLLAEIPITLERGDVIEKVKALFANVSSFEVTLGTVATGSEYFKNIYLEVHKDVNLTTLSQEAQNAFGMNAPYLPHLSLAYGTFSPEVQSKMVTDIPSHTGKRIRIDRIDVYQTEGMVDDWKKLAEFPLSK